MCLLSAPKTSDKDAPEKKKKMTKVLSGRFGVFEIEVGILKKFSLTDVNGFTENFSKKRLIESNPIVENYRGTIWISRVSRTDVVVENVVQVENVESDVIQETLQKWIQLSSPHLVGIFGYCEETDNEESSKQLVLIKEFSPLGTLESHLHPSSNQASMLTWKQRIIIAGDIAKALEYLHDPARRIILRLLRTANVHLTQDYRAKLFDLGLADLIGLDSASVTKQFGSHGYLCPNYSETSRISTRTDIYSYGVILLELMSGRKAVSESNEFIGSWAAETMKNAGTSVSILDENLKPQFPKPVARKLASIALKCVDKDPSKRPHAINIVEWFKAFDVYLNH